MRCPKCGYISFDDRENCLKCTGDLRELAEQLHGTAFAAKTPDFLAVALAAEEEAGEAAVDQVDHDVPPEEDEIELADVEPAEPPLEVSPEIEIEETPVAAPAEGVGQAPEEKPEESVEGQGEAEEIVELEPPELSLSESEEMEVLEEDDDMLDLASLSAPLPAETVDDAGELPDLAAPQAPVSPGKVEEAENLFEETAVPAAVEEDSGAKVAWPEDQEVEDITDLLNDTAPPPPSASEQGSVEVAEEPALNLDLDDDSPLGAPAPEEAPPEIPDLGLSLEIADEEEK